jgi:hypothetical protein
VFGSERGPAGEKCPKDDEGEGPIALGEECDEFDEMWFV